MGWLSPLIEQMSDDTLEACRHANLDDDFDWETPVTQLQVIREIAQEFDATPELYVPDGAHAQVQDVGRNLAQVMQRMLAFSYEKDSNAFQLRTQLSQEVAGYYNQFRELRIHARPPMPLRSELDSMRRALPDAMETVKLAEATLNESRELQATAKEIIQNLTSAAAESAGHDLSSHYRRQFQRHQALASRWLIAAGSAAVLLATASWLAFDGINVADKGDGVRFARDAIARLLLLGLGGYAVSFCSRGYRAQTHLAIVCEQKANALDTFVRFQETVTTDAGKEAVTLELVRAVFATSDSGYLEASSDRTIVQEQGGALMSLLAARGRT